MYTEITGLLTDIFTKKKHTKTFLHVNCILDKTGRQSRKNVSDRISPGKKVENGTIRERSYMDNSRILLLPHFSVGLAGHHTLAFISRIFCTKYTCVFIESESESSLPQQRSRIVRLKIIWKNTDSLKVVLLKVFKFTTKWGNTNIFLMTAKF